jgi:hypothetical protein
VASEAFARAKPRWDFQTGLCMQIVAKTLGVTLPLALSGRADEVIE